MDDVSPLPGHQPLIERNLWKASRVLKDTMNFEKLDNELRFDFFRHGLRLWHERVSTAVGLYFSVAAHERVLCMLDQELAKRDRSPDERVLYYKIVTSLKIEASDKLGLYYRRINS